MKLSCVLFLSLLTLFGRLSLLPNVAREIVRRGFTNGEISKILGGNLMRVLEKNRQGR